MRSGRSSRAQVIRLQGKAKEPIIDCGTSSTSADCSVYGRDEREDCKSRAA
jgi:hypothetical protein